MQTIDTKLWRNYQILIPTEVIEALGIRPGDSIRFTVEDGRIELLKAIA